MAQLLHNSWMVYENDIIVEVFEPREGVSM